MSTSLVQFKHTQTIIKRKIAEQAAAIERELGDAMDETLKAKNKFDAAKATAEQLVTKVSNADLRPEMESEVSGQSGKYCWKNETAGSRLLLQN